MTQVIGATRLTMKEAAEELRHSYSWLHANHRSLGLKGYRIGGRWYFDRSDLQSWAAETKASTPWVIANHWEPAKQERCNSYDQSKNRAHALG
jgi:hypothetical protein